MNDTGFHTALKADSTPKSSFLNPLKIAVWLKLLR